MTLKEYLASLYTIPTAKIYSRDITIYLSSEPGAATARHQDIVQYIGVLRSRYSNVKNLNRILAAIKVYYKYLCHTGARKDNPAQSIRLRDKQNRDIQLQDLFTAQELESLLHRKERYTHLEYRNKVLMGLLIYQGLQVKELAALSLSDIHLMEATVSIKSTPRSNGRTLSLKPQQIMGLHQYITEIRPKLLKGNSSDMLLIGQRGAPYSAEDITCHIKHSYKTLFAPRKVNAQTIRQSVITNLLKAGNDLRIVQVFAGHKYPDTTEKYKQTNVEALKTALLQYHPIK